MGRSWNSDNSLCMLRCSGRAAFDPDLDVATFEFELGDVFFDEELDEFFEFFLIHLKVAQPYEKCVLQQRNSSRARRPRHTSTQSVSKSLGQDVRISQP